MTDLWLNIVDIQNLRLKYSSPENRIEKKPIATKWQVSKVESFFMAIALGLGWIKLGLRWDYGYIALGFGWIRD